MQSITVKKFIDPIHITVNNSLMSIGWLPKSVHEALENGFQDIGFLNRINATIQEELCIPEFIPIKLLTETEDNAGRGRGKHRPKSFTRNAYKVKRNGVGVKKFNTNLETVKQYLEKDKDPARVKKRLATRFRDIEAKLPADMLKNEKNDLIQFLIMKLDLALSEIAETKSIVYQLEKKLGQSGKANEVIESRLPWKASMRKAAVEIINNFVEDGRAKTYKYRHLRDASDEFYDTHEFEHKQDYTKDQLYANVKKENMMAGEVTRGH